MAVAQIDKLLQPLKSKRFSLPASSRLKGEILTSLVFSKKPPKVHFSHPLRAWIVPLPNTGEPTQVQVLFSVPKKLHRKAHDRNHLKRLLKESYRLQKEPLTSQENDTPFALVIQYSVSGKESFAKVYKAVGHIIERIKGDR